MGKFPNNRNCSRCAWISVVSVVSKDLNWSVCRFATNADKNCEGGDNRCDGFCTTREGEERTRCNMRSCSGCMCLSRCVNSTKVFVGNKESFLSISRKCEGNNILWSLCGVCLCSTIRTRYEQCTCSNWTNQSAFCSSTDCVERTRTIVSIGFSEIESSRECTNTSLNCSSGNFAVESLICLCRDRDRTRCAWISVVSIVSKDTDWSVWCSSSKVEESRTRFDSCRNEAFLRTKLDTIEVTNSSVIIDNTIGLSTNTKNVDCTIGKDRSVGTTDCLTFDEDSTSCRIIRNESGSDDTWACTIFVESTTTG